MRPEDRSRHPDGIGGKALFTQQAPKHFPPSIRRDAGRMTGELLRECGLVPFAMVTGSRGIHVVAPLRRTTETPTSREELDDDALRPDGWTLHALPARLAERGGGPWADIAAHARGLAQAPRALGV